MVTRFFSRLLVFNLQEEVLKFNDICVCLSSQKNELETSLLNLENRSFEIVTFSGVNLK